MTSEMAKIAKKTSKCKKVQQKFGDNYKSAYLCSAFRKEKLVSEASICDMNNLFGRFYYYFYYFADCKVG